MLKKNVKPVIIYGVVTLGLGCIAMTSTATTKNFTPKVSSQEIVLMADSDVLVDALRDESSINMDADSQYNMGDRYYIGDGVEQDWRKAFEWYLKAANQGHVSAQVTVGRMYLYGRGVEQSYPKAASWYEVAAAQGDSEAQSMLGKIYIYSDGTYGDESSAKIWLNQACDNGGMAYCSVMISAQ